MMRFSATPSRSWFGPARDAGEITDKRIRRGVFRSVRELKRAIMAYIGGHNESPRRFVWTAKAERILEKARQAQAVLGNAGLFEALH